jgi:hypothetical protein
MSNYRSVHQTKSANAQAEKKNCQNGAGKLSKQMKIYKTHITRHLMQPIFHALVHASSAFIK